ncbi:Gfo/Idh/MocA family protein [Phytohabitans houttuyneae]|uniref:Inositol 2-dehydrogenase n=1 Tax=Phytohabitans houttuyneae TaxID=1076126 RepID=A0A6V8K783_9ACTN|nr:Gfo/Idh/MocA family oxidoreductase [Phytohabitans houttuyneae]GFJ79614.1 inositol 2-dehydrogenase [Phytohabitans houttuyneae]
MADLGIGIVGLHNHYHAYPFADYLRRGLPGLRLVGVADERTDLAKEFAAAYCDGSWTADYAELIRRDDVDAVIITSYTSAHADHVELAAEAGKPVLLDKPIATTMADARRIAAAGERVKVMMAYLLRYLPVYRQALEAVRAGAVGDLTSGFYSIRFPVGAITDSPLTSEQGWYADPVRGGGGGFLDHGVHFTDFFRWFFGAEAVDVSARIGTLTYKHLGVEDYGIATYTLDTGAIVTVESTWHAADYFGPLTSPDHASLSGTRGEIELHYQKSPQTEIQGVDEPWTGRRYVDLVGEERYEACYRDLLLAFRDWVGGAEPDGLPTAEDGLKALEMILAAYEADRTGTRVTFPLAEGAR